MSAAVSAERPRKRQRVDATRFLDLEATVDHDADLDDNAAASDREDDFINDEDDDDQEDTHIRLIHQLLIEDDREHEEYVEERAGVAPEEHRPHLSTHFNLMDELCAHIRRRKHRTASASSTSQPSPFEDAEQRPDVLWEMWGEPVRPDSDFYDDIESRLPKAGDMLFEIPCKRGHEEAAVLSVMFLATSPKCPRGGKSPSLAAAFSNPSLPGRIFLEVKSYSHAADVARRVPHLKPVDIVRIDLVDRLRPLQLSPPTNHKHNSWVHIERPISLCGRIGLVIQAEKSPAEIVVIPKGQHCNEDGLFIKAMGPTQSVQSLSGEEQVSMYDPVKVGSCIYCAAGFRYIMVQKSIVVGGDEIVPPIDELSVFFRACKISKDLYQQTLHQIQIQTLNEGDRVFLTQPDVAGLIGIFVSGDATTCRLYVPSLDIYLDSVLFKDIRRNFRVGDHVQTTDPRHSMHGVPLWIVALEDDQAMLVNLSDRSEHLANIHHLSFCDLDNIPLSVRLPPTKSRVLRRKLYTISFFQPMAMSSSWAYQNQIQRVVGRITDIASFNVAIGTLQFTPDETFSPPLSILPLTIGLEVELRDEHDLGGTAFISSWTKTYLTLVNLSPQGFELPHDHQHGLYDRHVGKWVFVIGGFYKGTRGLVKAITVDGRATVELQVLPLRCEIIHVGQLAAMKSDVMYGLELGQRLLPAPEASSVPSTSAWAATQPPVARPATPPITPPIIPLSPPSRTVPFATPVEHDCTWLGSPEFEGIPIKLVTRKGLAPSSSPYRFLRIERQPVDEGFSSTVWFMDRGKERSLPMSELCWMMCTGPGQTVVMTVGENCSQLYWTLGAVDDEMMCHLEPKVADKPSIMLPTCKLAQAFKPKR